MLTTIKLGGWLGRKYGKTFKMACRNAREAIAMIGANRPGFEADFIKHSYQVIVDKERIGEEDVEMPIRGKCIRFIPVFEGSGNVGRIIAGVVLVVVGVYSKNPALVQFGASLIIGGVVGMMFGTPPSTGSSSEDGSRTSYLFGGTTNTTGQGNIVPILYGEGMCGSQVISTGISTESI